MTSTGRPDPHTYRGRPWNDPLFAPTGLIECLHTAVTAYSERTAVTEVSVRGEVVRSVTYRQLWDEVASQARRVPVDTAGVGRTVAVTVTNTIASLATVLGVVRAGAAAVVIDAAEPRDRRDEMVCVLGCAVMEPDGQITAPRRGVDPASAEPGKPVWPTAVVVFTTGSTAASKPVAQSGYSIAVNARAVAAHHAIGPGTRLVCPLPISHVNGLELGMVATLLSGGHAVLLQGFDPFGFARTLAESAADLVTTVPSILDVILSVSRVRALPRLRHIISAAAPLHSSTARGVMDRWGKRVVQGYGLSECMNFATTMPVEMEDVDYKECVLDAEIPPVGHALPGCEVAVLDGDGQPVAEGDGEVCIRGHSVMSGYLANPTETAKAFRGGWLRTGDIGRLVVGPTGAPLLTLTGRAKHIAKCGGIGVSFEEIERAARRSSAVKDVCCVARPHRLLGEALTLFVVAHSGTGDGIGEVRARVGSVANPRRVGLKVIEVDALPRLRSGKPDRRKLSVLAADSAGRRTPA